MRHANIIMFDGTAGAQPISGVISLAQFNRLSVQAITADSPTVLGTLKVQISNDHPTGLSPGYDTPTNWSDLGGASVSIAGSGTFLLGFNDVCAEWARLVWSLTSGHLGTLKATLVMLGWGGQ